jgi:hypothetical protein
MPSSILFLREKWIILLILSGYVIFQYPFLYLDFWNDEIYSLKYFTLVSPFQTITDYHVPNNHIFFNLVDNFYLNIIGEKNIYSLMDHPWVLRLVPFCYSLGTIYFTYACMEKATGKMAAVVALIILCTSVPYYNFAVEVRGYSLSTFLLLVLTYLLFIPFKKQSKTTFFFIILLVALAVYAIPLNLYPVLSILFFMIARMFFFLLNNQQTGNLIPYRQQGKERIFFITSIMAGILVGLLFYNQVFRQVFFNEYVIKDVDFTFSKWVDRTEQVLTYFFSYRYWILPFMLIGLSVHGYRWIKKKPGQDYSFVIFLMVIVFFPFIISLCRRDAPPDRTFLNLLPFFSMFIAWMINGIAFLPVSRKHLLFFETGLLVYCFVVLSFQFKSVKDHLLHDINTSGRSHSIYYNYYLDHFHPLAVVNEFKRHVYHDSDFVTIHDSEPYDLPVYLEKFKIPVQSFSLMDSVLKAGKKVFLFSRYPGAINNDLFRSQHRCLVTKVSEGISYHNLFLLQYQN